MPSWDCAKEPESSKVAQVYEWKPKAREESWLVIRWRLSTEQVGSIKLISKSNHKRRRKRQGEAKAYRANSCTRNQNFKQAQNDGQERFQEFRSLKVQFNQSKRRREIIKR